MLDEVAAAAWPLVGDTDDPVDALAVQLALAFVALVGGEDVGLAGVVLCGGAHRCGPPWRLVA